MDFGEGKWIVGRVRHRCEWCSGPIPKGESHYQSKGMYDGEWQNWRMHAECQADYDLNYGGGEFFPGDGTMPERVVAIIEAERATRALKNSLPCRPE